MLELRKQGKSFREIAKELNCPKSSVSYFFRSKTRKAIKEKQAEYANWERNLIRNVSRFQSKESYIYSRTICKD